jgi:hypothetical protein
MFGGGDITVPEDPPAGEGTGMTRSNSRPKKMAEAGLAMEPIPLEERTTLSAKVMSTPPAIHLSLSLSLSLSLVAYSPHPSEMACLADFSCHPAAAHGQKESLANPKPQTPNPKS